jgi:4-oxalocrotonate tautomerase
MPFVTVKVLAGTTLEQRKGIVEDITRSLEQRLGKAPERTHVVIEEVAMDYWGNAGTMQSEKNLM